MTSDEFKAAYRPGQQLTSEGIRTTLAQETRKGRIVLVHELSPASEDDRRRVDVLLRQLGPADASQVIGTFQVDGADVVVTKYLPGFSTFLAWLDAAATESRGSENVATLELPETTSPSSPADDSLDLAQGRSPSVLSTTTPEASLHPPEDQAPGTFTQLFGESAPPAVVPDGPASGSFTKLFGEPPPAPSPPTTPNSEGFASLFRDVGSMASTSNVPDATQDGPRTPEATSPAKPPESEGPIRPDSVRPEAEPATGEFTRLFGGESNQPPAAPAPPFRVPSSGPSPAAFAPSPPPIRRPPQTQSGEQPAGSFAEPSADFAAPGPPRIRPSILEGGGPNTPRPDSSATPPPFAVRPLDLSESPSDPATPLTMKPDLRAPAQPVVRNVPAGGGYTEVLTPAPPPLTPGTPRTPTPSPTTLPPPKPPRPSYLPLIVALSVFGLVAVVVVVYFVLSA